KGAPAAYTPVGITATNEAVSDFFKEELFCHGHTYAYHPLAASAISAAISEFKKLAATGQMETTARHLKEQLYKLADKHVCIGDVRGIGHFWALEIVKNRETKEPFDVKADKLSGKALMTGKIVAEAMANGVYMAAWYDTLVIAPPLIITEAEIDEGIAVLDTALKIGDAEALDTGVPASRSAEFSR
ncbi:MAG: aminotransferase class III-fold pyridoxal phosphate-dependent enzyme, partial [Deltaproteobacteria bacterium]|nr:aminotransferase class III-fold pyridoxal phosphate-dependent enzyme [Deltaproteobacteria bacterium]